MTSWGRSLEPADVGGGVGAVLNVGRAERGGLLQEIDRHAAAPVRVGAARHGFGESMGTVVKSGTRGTGMGWGVVSRFKKTVE